MPNEFAGCDAHRAGNGSWTAPPRDFIRHVASCKTAGGGMCPCLPVKDQKLSWGTGGKATGWGGC